MFNPYSDMCFDWQNWWQIQTLSPADAAWYFSVWDSELDYEMTGIPNCGKLIHSEAW